MKTIFISYRRNDTAAYAGRLYDRLVGHYGSSKIFMDVDGIGPGQDFLQVIEETINQSEAVIVIIGPNWLHETNENNQRRIDISDDFVHIEIAKSLQGNCRVIPVLFNDAKMPSADQLPLPLRKLSKLHAIAIRDGAAFHRDIQPLINALDQPQAVKKIKSKTATEDKSHINPERSKSKITAKNAATSITIASILAAVFVWPQLRSDPYKSFTEYQASTPIIEHISENKTTTNSAPPIPSPQKEKIPSNKNAIEDQKNLTPKTAPTPAQDANRMMVLAHKYATGDGVEKNLEMAAKWYLEAAIAGDKQAPAKVTATLQQWQSEIEDKKLLLRTENSAPSSNPSVRNEIEFQIIKNELEKLSQMQKALSNVLEAEDELAKSAVRKIKA